jgi:hypothetical protein
MSLVLIRAHLDEVMQLDRVSKYTYLIQVDRHSKYTYEISLLIISFANKSCQPRFAPNNERLA